MKKRTTVLVVLICALFTGAFSSLSANGEIVGKYPYKFGNVGITFDQANNAAYVYHESEHTVYKLNGTDFSEISSVPVPFSLDQAGYAWSMTFDGTNLWLACPWNDGYQGLYGMDPATGDSVGFIDPGVGGLLRGVDWDGTNFWIGTNDNGAGMIYQVNTEGTQLQSFAVNEVAWLNQICFAEDEIWINDDRFYFASYSLDGTFIDRINSQIPGDWGQLSHDLAFDGNDVISVCWDQDVVYKMYIGKGHGGYLLAPTNLTAESDASSKTSIQLSWTNPSTFLNGDAGSAASINIYSGDTGELIGNTTDQQFTVTDLVEAQYYTFYLIAVSDQNREGVTSSIFGIRAGGPLQGDVINELPLGRTGWVAVAYDGNYAWMINEGDNKWYKIDKNTGETLKTFDNPEGAPANSQGAAWSKYGTIYANQFSAGTGEVWEIDTNGTVVNFWPTDILGASGATNRQRGLAIHEDIVWVGRGNVDNVPNNELFRFDLDGVPMESAFVDTPITYSGGMEWVEGQLWVNDRPSDLIRIYDYDGDKTLTQVNTVSRPNGAMWGLAYTGDEILTAAFGGTESLFWLKTDLSTTDVDDNMYSIPNEFVLGQNYPNPFNPSTTIGYSIPDAGIVNITVYNLLGQKIVTLLNEFKQAGNHTVEWNTGSGVTSGVYFYSIKSGKHSAVRKMVVLQ